MDLRNNIELSCKRLIKKIDSEILNKFQININNHEGFIFLSKIVKILSKNIENEPRTLYRTNRTIL